MDEEAIARMIGNAFNLTKRARIKMRRLVADWRQRAHVWFEKIIVNRLTYMLNRNHTLRSVIRP